jgi:hypothetical protein
MCLIPTYETTEQDFNKPYFAIFKGVTASIPTQKVSRRDNARV